MAADYIRDGFRRALYNGSTEEPYALWSDKELVEDSRSETDPITDYPEGLSLMKVSALENWNGWEEDGQVRTFNTEGFGQQQLFTATSSVLFQRDWYDGALDWDSWYEPWDPSIIVHESLVQFGEQGLGTTPPRFACRPHYRLWLRPNLVFRKCCSELDGRWQCRSSCYPS